MPKILTYRLERPCGNVRGWSNVCPTAFSADMGKGLESKFKPPSKICIKPIIPEYVCTGCDVPLALRITDFQAPSVSYPEDWSGDFVLLPTAPCDWMCQLPTHYEPATEPAENHHPFCITTMVGRIVQEARIYGYVRPPLPDTTAWRWNLAFGSDEYFEVTEAIPECGIKVGDQYNYNGIGVISSRVVEQDPTLNCTDGFDVPFDFLLPPSTHLVHLEFLPL